MIKKPQHILLVFMLLLLNPHLCDATEPVQEPEVNRVFDSSFKERYSSDIFDYEGKKVVNRSKSGSGEYEDYNSKEARTKEQNNGDEVIINLGPFRFVFYIILAMAVVYLAYALLNEGGTGLFTSSKNKNIERHDAITAENIENTDIHTLINQAENDNDYRLAIRYYYLLVLKTLSLKNYIKFEDDKTNTEYLNELRETPFNGAFSYVSYLYNYIWYGRFELEASQYAKAKNNFITLLKQVN
ncbi:hypothetical protein SAMN05421824_2451 [Hyunsoonleella jejuensis]|uniref:DUF4129 domain-containing protein n=1 Tax=Hyunsoonleella jejuensis TaxID=419940 RepID=A0A1H9JAZ1_9FLAO|nr:hypothetical protein [Hyunsoonleella jejuensis]SEQ83953.1 hypothetical protein SAMN05421824_2451 [Hyunsoonleella jejuensis]